MNNHDLFNIFSSQSAQELSPWARIRRGFLITIGSGCLILGAVLIMTLVRPETLQSMGTLELGAIVGFVVMPAFTLLSLQYDRSVVKRVGQGVSGQPQAQSPRAHRAHQRGVRVVLHTRINDFVDSEPNIEHAKKSRQSV